MLSCSLVSDMKDTSSKKKKSIDVLISLDLLLFVNGKAILTILSRVFTVYFKNNDHQQVGGGLSVVGRRMGRKEGLSKVSSKTTLFVNMKGIFVHPQMIQLIHIIWHI